MEVTTASSQPWVVESIGGRRAAVFDPGPGRKGTVVFLHGYSGETLESSDVFTRELQKLGLMAVCPDGGKSWWLDLRTSEFPDQSPQQHIFDQVLPWIETQTGRQCPAIGLIGIGMGGQGVLNLSYRHARKFPCVAAISPTIDFYRVYGRGTLLDNMFANAELARQQSAILHLHPLNWPEHQFFCCDPRDPLWYEGCERLASKLNSSGVPFECDLTTRAGVSGWGWDYFESMASRALGHLAESLQRHLPMAPPARSEPE